MKACLPTTVNRKICRKCLTSEHGSNCQQCASACPCYCQKLCRTQLKPMMVAKEFIVTPPKARQDPSRLIPRIIHQTWFEPVNATKYPHMHKLMQSFRNQQNVSGWEYRFYTDEDAVRFLQIHFPIEVLQAYNALLPGAFRADLFRYCVLLIHGGLYADFDVLLTVDNLDDILQPDVGFMVPQDADPGKAINKTPCLWNGLMASAPSHLFLAQVIDTVVHNVRNRFTSVDLDASFCSSNWEPNPESKSKTKYNETHSDLELSILHRDTDLFVTGPCILGPMVNQVLGRPLQTSFEASEIVTSGAGIIIMSNGTRTSIASTSKVHSDTISRIPGRTIILHQKKADKKKGRAHRFTLLASNTNKNNNNNNNNKSGGNNNDVVVAMTDLPQEDDRENVTDAPAHYRSTSGPRMASLFGLKRVYADRVQAKERLRFQVAHRPER